MNALEVAANLRGGKELSTDDILIALQRAPLVYDKGAEEHYNVISAFIKSMRGSDPDAAIYWLARMIEAGEDPLFIVRRMVIFAAEDIGNAKQEKTRISRLEKAIPMILEGKGLNDKYR